MTAPLSDGEVAELSEAKLKASREFVERVTRAGYAKRPIDCEEATYVELLGEVTRLATALAASEERVRRLEEAAEPFKGCDNRRHDGTRWISCGDCYGCRLVAALEGR